MKKTGIIYICALAAVLSGCTGKEPVSSEGSDDMTGGNFSEELVGNWKGYQFTDETIQFLNDHEAVLVNENGEETKVTYTAEEGSVFDPMDHKIIPEGEELPYDELVHQTKEQNGKTVFVLYGIHWTNKTSYKTTRFYVFEEHTEHVPDDYYPAPWAMPEPYTPDTSHEKQEDIVPVLTKEAVLGSWKEVWPGKEEEIVFGEDDTVQMKDTYDNEVNVEYNISSGSFNGIARLINVYGSDLPYYEIAVQTQLVNGYPVQLLFGWEPEDGGDEPYRYIRVYARPEQADLIPEGYKPVVADHPYTK